MGYYENLSKEDLIYKCQMLQNEVDSLKRQLSAEKDETNHLRFRIEQELEPRIRQERRAYDNWVTNPER